MLFLDLLCLRNLVCSLLLVSTLNVLLVCGLYSAEQITEALFRADIDMDTKDGHQYQSARWQYVQMLKDDIKELMTEREKLIKEEREELIEEVKREETRLNGMKRRNIAAQPRNRTNIEVAFKAELDKVRSHLQQKYNRNKELIMYAFDQRKGERQKMYRIDKLREPPRYPGFQPRPFIT